MVTLAAFSRSNPPAGRTSTRAIQVALTCAVLLGSGNVTAQQAKATASHSVALGTATGSSADSHAQAEGVPSADDTLNYDFELGVFTGVFFPSPGHNLYRYEPHREYEVATRYEFGGRVGFFPNAWLGLEAEFMHARGGVSRQSDVERKTPRADFNAYRGQLVLQVPSDTFIPFLVIGGGMLQALSTPLGPERDEAGHAGIGFRVRLTRDLALRVDARENLTERRNDSFGGLAFHEEVQLGLSALLGVPPPAPQRPPPDRDGDTVPDDSDACPDVPALTADGCPVDSDGDGIIDSEDHCPREAGVAPDGCPDLDTDKDGVPLPCDLCPDEPGLKPDGCPLRDTDGDGILDDKDRCPKDPETVNGYEDDDGCPDEVPKEVEAFTGTIQGIQFQVGSARIQAASSATLGKAAAVLNKFSSIRIRISGHTSSEGDPDFNDKLSFDRANAVKDWLTNAGVDPERITVRGVGSREPVADNDTQAGRAQNRRIEFELLKN
jgi:outer membrane protein OmpA-like peptidoglycan-associated protein